MENLKEDMKLIKTFIHDMTKIKNQMNDLIQAVQFVSNKFDEQQEMNKKLKNEMDEIKREDKMMREELLQLGGYVNRKQSEKWKTNIVLSGLPKVDEPKNIENVKKILNILRILGDIMDEAKEISATNFSSTFFLN